MAAVQGCSDALELAAREGGDLVELIGLQVSQLSIRCTVRRPDQGGPRTLEAMQMQQMDPPSVGLIFYLLHTGQSQRLLQAQHC